MKIYTKVQTYDAYRNKMINFLKQRHLIINFKFFVKHCGSQRENTGY